MLLEHEITSSKICRNRLSKCEHIIMDKKESRIIDILVVHVN